MKADLKFNKRGSATVDGNYTDAAFDPFANTDHPIRMRVFGPEGSYWRLCMNPLEAHLLSGQINAALAQWAKAQIKKDRPND